MEQTGERMSQEELDLVRIVLIGSLAQFKRNLVNQLGQYARRFQDIEAIQAVYQGAVDVKIAMRELVDGMNSQMLEYAEQNRLNYVPFSIDGQDSQTGWAFRGSIRSCQVHIYYTQF